LLQAQVPAGWIQGSLLDSTTSAGIGNAEVTLEDSDGHELMRATSAAAGEFHFLAVPSRRYSLRVHPKGYPSYQIDSVVVQDGLLSLIIVRMEKTNSRSPATVILAWPGEPADPWSSVRQSRIGRARLDNLPSALNLWALLQNQEAASVTNHIDEGGMETGVPALVGVHGGTWTQNGYRWDGLNITDPHTPGKPLAYPDLASLQELHVSGDSRSAALYSPGAEFQLVSIEGSGHYHGRGEAFYLGEPLQSSNLDSRLRGFGFQTTPHFRQFPEGHFSLGGPLCRSVGWAFFTALEVQHVSRVIPDFAGRPGTGVYSGIIRLDGSLRPQDHLTMLVSGQIVHSSNLGAASGVDPSSTLHGNDRYELVQGHWTHRRGNNLTWDLSFGFSHASPTDTLQAGMTQPSYTRLFTGEMRGAAPIESDSALSRFSLLGHAQTFGSISVDVRHRLEFGFDIEESLSTEEQRVYQGLNVFLFPGDAPSEVAEFNSPSHAKQRLRELSLFVEDYLEMAGRVFVRLGLNLDRSNAFLPAQSSGAGAFVPARNFGGAGSIVSWTTLSPRLGLAVPLWRRYGETRFTAGYSRYYHILPASYADFANPTALGGRLYRWNDANLDGTFQPGEEGTLLRVFGGPYSSVDPALKRPFTDEFEIGLEQSCGRRLQAGLKLLQRRSRRLVQTINTGVAPTGYTPVRIFDPGDDNIPGTSDDQILTVYNQNPSSLGQDHYLLTNPPGLESNYRGLEAALSGRPFERGYFSLSFNAYKSEGRGNPGNSELENDTGVIGSLFDNPNTLINARGRLFFDRAYMAKLATWYEAPFGFRLGTAVSYFDGLPFGRRLIVPDLNQGPFFVMATPRGEPGGFRTQYNLDFDQRVSREFRFHGTGVLLMLDAFNLLNQNRSLREFDISGPLFPQRRPTVVENPRVFRLGIRITF
jgi:hypothetical protein